MPDVDVAVIGAGISGLTFAHYLQKRGLSTCIVEGSPEAGGSIRTIQAGPYIAEGGPQNFAATAQFNDLTSDLGLTKRVRFAKDTASKRYFYVDGRLVAAPASLAELLRSPLLSISGKLRLAREPITSRGDDAHETVARFITRRAGREVLDKVGAAVVSGVFAGDASNLELRSAFPALAELERDHGSVVRGAMKKMAEAEASDARPVAATFDSGNRVLTDALAAGVGDALHTGCTVAKLSIFHGGVEVRSVWPGLAVTASRAVIATSAQAAAHLLADAEPMLASDLRAIDCVPVAQIVLSCDTGRVGTPTDGFGFLAPPREGLRILGAVWNSSVFADRAPPGETLVTAFIGGALNRTVLDHTDGDLASMAQEDLAAAMRMDGRPRVIAGFRWEKAIPQYTVGHAERLRRIDGALSRMPRIALLGNYLRGISVNECIRQARRAAEKFAV